MRTRMVLYADDGMVLTNGEHYGKVIWLAEGADPAVYRQITETEFETWMEANGVGTEH